MSLSRRFDPLPRIIANLQRQVDELNRRASRIGHNHLGGFRRFRDTSPQSIPDTTPTNLEFNGFAFNEITDFLSWDATNDEFDVARACTATIYGGVQFAADATGERQIQLTVNGVTIASQRLSAAGAGTTMLNAASGPVQLALNDTVSVAVFQNSGAALDAQAADRTFGAIQIHVDRS